MKGLLIGAVMIGQMAAQGVVTMDANGGQRSTGYSLGSVGVVRVGDAVPVLAVSNPRRWGLRRSAGRHGDTGFGDWGYVPDPYFYPEGDADPYPVLPGIIVLIPVIQKAETPPPPPATARPEIHEFHGPSSSSSSGTTYSIVSKDGRVQRAALVWVEGDALGYYAPDHSTGLAPIDSLDLQATRQRNAGQQLPWLPAQSQTTFCLNADAH